MCGKIFYTLLCVISMAQYCAGTPTKQFQYRGRLIRYLLQEYESMCWNIVNSSQSVLTAYEQALTNSSSSLVEVQNLSGQIALMRKAIDEMPRYQSADYSRNFFRLALFQEFYLSFLEQKTTQLRGLIQKDFSTMRRRTQAFQAEYLRKFNESISGYLAHISRGKYNRERQLTDWFENFVKLEGNDLKIKKVPGCLARFQVISKFDKRSSLHAFILKQYAQLFEDVTKIIKPHLIVGFNSRYLSNCLELSQFVKSVLDEIEAAIANESKYSHLLAMRAVFHTFLEMASETPSDADDEPIKSYWEYCTIESLADIEHELLKRLRVFIEKIIAACDSYTDAPEGTFPYNWLKRFENEDGLEQLHVLEEFIVVSEASIY